MVGLVLMLVAVLMLSILLVNLLRVIVLTIKVCCISVLFVLRISWLTIMLRLEIFFLPSFFVWRVRFLLLGLTMLLLLRLHLSLRLSLKLLLLLLHLNRVWYILLWHKSLLVVHLLLILRINQNRLHH